MSDVVTELTNIIFDEYRRHKREPMYPPYAEELADAILERFDVTPKAVITEQRLGEMVGWAIRPLPVASEYAVQYGENMFRLLDDAGLEIVRKEAGE